MKKYVLKYDRPAPKVNDGCFEWDKTNNPYDGWEKWSLPLGNGFFGANVFGRTDTERIQITENSFANPMDDNTCGAGLNNLAEISIDFDDLDITDYERGLDINNSLAYTVYKGNGVKYEREYIASYPDRILVIKLSCEKNNGMNFKVSANSPFVRGFCNRENDGMGKTCDVFCSENRIILHSYLEYYQVFGEVIISVVGDGEIVSENNSLIVKNSTESVIYITAGTNYKLESNVFTEPDSKKKLCIHQYPHEELLQVIRQAESKGYNAIKNSHLKDYTSLFSRTSIDLGGKNTGITTDEELANARHGADNRYLIEMLFAYGKYLIISSSRDGCLPANLQGIWNCYGNSPWSSGYWHNINVQMNYWFTFGCGLAELFKPYADFCLAYLKSAMNGADEYVKKLFSENYSGVGKNGWSIATGAWPYEIQPALFTSAGHSGPGTGAMTAMLFWDLYDYTNDLGLLKEVCYPILYGAALFLSKIMIERDGKWLIKYSASPEQWHNGECYRTEGCAFEQQTCYEVFSATLKAAEKLQKTDDDLIRTLNERINKLEPFIIGKSGQIKEFREEMEYGEFGEKHHRHISQLMSVYPGLSFDKNDAILNNAVQKTLELRGDLSTGWAMTHRICAWARTGNSKHCLKLINDFISNGILTNLWDSHPPFQIDGNFGFCAGLYEMLIHSHTGVLELLPTLPEEWKDGSFYGLVARGGFIVNAEWADTYLKSLNIESIAGSKLKLKQTNFTIQKVLCENAEIEFVTEKNIISFPTQNGKKYTLLLKVEG